GGGHQGQRGADECPLRWQQGRRRGHRQAHRRKGDCGRNQRGRLRPRPLQISRPRRRTGRRRPRSRVKFLRTKEPKNQRTKNRANVRVLVLWFFGPWNLRAKRTMAAESRGDYIDKTVQIKRCAAVVKGGRRFSFAALVVVGDG